MSPRKLGFVAILAAVAYITLWSVNAKEGAQKANPERKPAAKSGEFFCSKVNDPVDSDKLQEFIGKWCDTKLPFTMYYDDVAHGDRGRKVITYCCTSK
ncbi:MAG: hypothetical protein AB1540_13440 [Bdellovibrionota bacterium]